MEKRGGGTLSLSGNNTYSGGTTIKDGRIKIQSASNLGSAGTLTLDGGGLMLGASVTLTRELTVASGGGTFDTNGYDGTINAFSGSGTFTKSGAGNLTLAQATVVFRSPAAP